MSEHLNQYEDNLGYLIGRCGRAMARMLTAHIEQEGFEGMNVEHWIVLRLLWVSDGRTQQELCKVAGKDKTALSRAIDWLETYSYVVRIPDKQDRRQKLIYLTKSGRQLEHRLVPVADRAMSFATSGIDPDELHTCKNTLRKIFDNVQEYI